MEVISDLERLIAIEDIKILKARRDRLVDAQDWEAYEALHAPDHQSHNDGHEKWNTAREMIENLRQFLAPVRTIHHSHTPEITFESPTRASGIWALEDYTYWPGTEEWMQGYGYYYETYEKRDGQWLFTSRKMKRVKTVWSPRAKELLAKLQAEERARYGVTTSPPAIP